MREKRATKLKNSAGFFFLGYVRHQELSIKVKSNCRLVWGSTHLGICFDQKRNFAAGIN